MSELNKTQSRVGVSLEHLIQRRLSRWENYASVPYPFKLNQKGKCIL